MNRLKKYISIITSTLLLSILITGCELKPNNTVIDMSETKTAKDEADKKKDFELEGIKTIEKYGMVRGWLGDEILILTNDTPEQNEQNGQTEFRNEAGFLNLGFYKWRNIEKYNLDSDNYEKLLTNPSITDVVLSPDKSKFAYIHVKEDKSREVILRNTNEETEEVILTAEKSMNIGWSNNSKYLSLVDNGKLLIVDTENMEEYYVALDNLNIRYENTKAIVSNDGQRILVENDFNLYLVNLMEPLIQQEAKVESVINLGENASDNINDTSTFYNNTSVLYIMPGAVITSLAKYDLETNKTEVILQDASTFSFNPQTNILAYQLYVGDLYVCEFNGEKVENIKLVFKGNIAGEIWWNYEGDKLLFCGREAMGEENFKNYVATFTIN